MKKLFLALLLSTGVANAVDFRTIEPWGGGYLIYQRTTNDSQIFAGSLVDTHSVTGTLLSIGVEAVGGNVTAQLSHSTGAYKDSSDVVYQNFWVSSPTVVLSGAFKTFDVRGYVQDPWLKISGLSGSVTAYVTMEYMMPIAKSSAPIQSTR